MKSTLKRLLDFIKLFAFIAVLAAGAGVLGYLSTSEVSGPARILDGDSLVVGNREIRLFGIDAPEFDQVCAEDASGKTTYPCGRRSAAHLRSLVEGAIVRCRGREEDKFGRLLAVCETDRIAVLNAKMVRDGWAVSFGDYDGLEAEAKSAQTGMWRGDFDRPATWRRRDAKHQGGGWMSNLFNW